MGMRVKDEFQIARERASQQAQAAKQQQTDALKRRFSAAGMSNSGAAIQQQRLANEGVDKQLAQSNEGIDAAQQTEVRRVNEIKEGRDFQRSEREASQGFQSGMMDKQFGFTRAEREASQGFAAGESALSRALQKEMQKGQFDFARGEREASQTFAGNESAKAQMLQEQMFLKDLGMKKDAFNESKRQYDQTYGMSVAQALQDAQVQDFNMEAAAKQAGVDWGGFIDTSSMGFQDGMQAIATSLRQRRLQRSADAQKAVEEQQRLARGSRDDRGGRGGSDGQTGGGDSWSGGDGASDRDWR